jgi:hypothetical protein
MARDNICLSASFDTRTSDNERDIDIFFVAAGLAGLKTVLAYVEACVKS